MSGLATSGYPRIKVTRDEGTLVKEVDKTDGGDPTAIFEIDNDTPVELGVYLPSGTEGTVEVSAEIVAKDGPCDLTCGPQAVNVHGGDVTSVALTLSGDKHACAATKPDAGADAASDSRADANKTDAADASEEGTATVDDCMAYCTSYGMVCPNNVDSDLSICLSECKAAHWPVGSPNDLTGQNTLTCRKRHLNVGADKTLDCSECSAGSPASPGVCVSPIDAGARDACPLTP